MIRRRPPTVKQRALYPRGGAGMLDGLGRRAGRPDRLGSDALLRSLLNRPEFLLAGTFAVLILGGTLLLRLPAAQAAEPVGWIDALFTATSAVCVTGLITVDTEHAFTHFGKVVILVLIQLGGLGIMTFGALVVQLLHLRLSFSGHLAWQSSFFEGPARLDLRRALLGIFALTFVFEALGAVLIYWGLQGHPQRAPGWFEAVFLAVSAYCNAGFSVYSDNVAGLRDSPLILTTFMALIVIGGLGYLVLLEALHRAWCRLRGRRPRMVVWTLHSKVVLAMSALLVFGGAAALLLTGLTPTENTWGLRVVHALFQSVTARTAGFNTVDIGALPLPSLLILIGLMFIGGSPGSCAGGIKTTTAAVWSARVRSRLTGREGVRLFERHIPPGLVRRAALLLAIAGLWNMGGVLVLSMVEQSKAFRLEQLVFEQISAFATVGLSAHPGAAVSLSASFSDWGKLSIVFTMFMGRVGPLTLAVAVLPRARTLYRYPTERVMIG